MKKHERRRELHDDEVYVEKIATLTYDEWSCEWDLAQYQFHLLLVVNKIRERKREKERKRERERERMVSRKSTHKHPLAMGVISSTERMPINFTHNKSSFSGKKMYLIFCIKRQNLSTVLICYNIFRSIIILFIISITETTQHHT